MTFTLFPSFGKPPRPLRWSVQVNDVVGGWVVTSYPHPLSEHDFRPNGDPNKRGVIAAECNSERMAQRISEFLDAYGPAPTNESYFGGSDG